ncbi:MAG: TIM barrel protein [Planctomycetota bacterium]|nr:TIM barrel protein [Planctomycetota bacterium]MEE2895105.1 TIM barrel protein [Planctomycetota bacterium]
MDDSRTTRRGFIGAAGAAAAVGASVPSAMGEAARGRDAVFKLNYAPHFGMFNAVSGDDHLDQIRYAHDQGFRAWEDNGMPGRSAEEQSRIGDELRRLGMTMGVFVSEADFGRETLVLPPDQIQDHLRTRMESAIEVAKRCGATWTTVVPGRYSQRTAPDFQTANCIENLKFCAGLLEPHGLVMVLEPLNRRDHPGLFLTGIPQAYLICRAVGSPSCRILDDLYHQQITEGNLVPFMDQAWSEIAYFQVGDNPGRREPTTGEIDYRNIFRHIHSRGFDGIVGMEHGMSRGGKEGVERLVAAYRECDDFRD